jgi:hypothetical protein
MCAAAIERFFWVKRGVDAPENDSGSAFSCGTSYGIAAQSVTSVNAYADDVAGPENGYVQRFQRFIPNGRVAELLRR